MIFAMGGRLVAMAFSVICLASWTTPVKAQETPCRSFEADSHKPGMVRWLRQYYRQRSSSTVSAGVKLNDQVTWHLAIDASTNLALPRIELMPNREAMEKANRLLDAAHGCLLVEYASWAGYWYSAAVSASEQGIGMFAPRSHFIWQPDPKLIELTYASERLVSYVDVRVQATDGQAYYIEPRGWVLDLDRGAGYEIASCESAEDDRRLFRLADFLDVCTIEARTRFLSLWSAAIEIIVKSPDFGKDPYFGVCHREMGALDDRSMIALHLTERGLAVHSGAFPPGLSKHCLDFKSSINPVIIPYRELMEFLKPGPWRDELLSLK